MNVRLWKSTFLHLSCSPDHQPRRDVSMHKQLYIDQTSLKALQNTAKRHHMQVFRRISLISVLPEQSNSKIYPCCLVC